MNKFLFIDPLDRRCPSAAIMTVVDSTNDHQRPPLRRCRSPESADDSSADQPSCSSSHHQAKRLRTGYSSSYSIDSLLSDQRHSSSAAASPPPPLRYRWPPHSITTTAVTSSPFIVTTREMVTSCADTTMLPFECPNPRSFMHAGNEKPEFSSDV